MKKTHIFVVLLIVISLASCGGNKTPETKEEISKYLVGQWEIRVENGLYTFEAVDEFKEDHSYQSKMRFPAMEKTGLLEKDYELTITAEWSLKDGNQIVLSNIEGDDPDFKEIEEEMQKEYEKEGDIIVRLNENELVLKGEEGEPDEIYKKINRSLFLTLFLFFGMACMLGGAIGIIIKAFKTSIAWGIGCLVIALLQWVFVATHWKKSWKPFVVQILGFTIMFCTAVITEKTNLSIYRF